MSKFAQPVIRFGPFDLPAEKGQRYNELIEASGKPRRVWVMEMIDAGIEARAAQAMKGQKGGEGKK